MTGQNPTVLQVIQEDIPNFNNVYLVYIQDNKLPKHSTETSLILRSDLDKIEYNQDFDLIYDPEVDGHFFKELGNYNKKLICNDLILRNKSFFTRSIKVDTYNLLINSKSTNIISSESLPKEAM